MKFFWPWCKMSGWQQQPHQLPHRGSADWGRPEPRHNNTQSRLFLTQNCCLRNAKHKKITNTERYISQTQKTYTYFDRSTIGMAPSLCCFLIKRTANFWYFLLNGKASLVSIQFSDGTEAHTDMHCKSKIIKVGITFTFAPSEWSELTEALRQAASDKDLEFRHLAFPDYQQGVPKVSARVIMQ